MKNLAILYQRKGQFEEALAAAKQAKAAASETDLEDWDPFITTLEEELRK